VSSGVPALVRNWPIDAVVVFDLILVEIFVMFLNQKDARNARDAAAKDLRYHSRVDGQAALPTLLDARSAILHFHICPVIELARSWDILPQLLQNCHSKQVTVELRALSLQNSLRL
jgi:hypothetical protein